MLTVLLEAALGLGFGLSFGTDLYMHEMVGVTNVSHFKQKLSEVAVFGPQVFFIYIYEL